MVELFTPSIAIVTQLKKLHHFSHLALETSSQCNCSLKYSAVYTSYEFSSLHFVRNRGCPPDFQTFIRFRSLFRWRIYRKLSYPKSNGVKMSCFVKGGRPIDLQVKSGVCLLRWGDTIRRFS